MWTNSRLLGDCNSLTCCGDKTICKERKSLSVQGFLSEIIFIRASSRGWIHFLQDTPVDSRPVCRVQAGTYLCLQTPTQRQMSGLRKQPAFLLVWSEGAPAAWLNAATPILTALPHRAFSELLTANKSPRGQMDRLYKDGWGDTATGLKMPDVSSTSTYPTPPVNQTDWNNLCRL